MKKSLWVFPMCLMLAGCLMTREQIRDGASHSEFGEPARQAQVSEMQVRRAEEAARSDELEESLRVLRGQVEVLQNQIQTMESQNREEAASEDQQQKMSVGTMNEKFLAFEEALRALEKQVAALHAEMQGLRTKTATRTPSRPTPERNELGNYTGAEQDFSKKNWKKAIVGYEKYRELNPKGRRYSEATYKIGVCFQELGMKAEAKAFYEEVLAKYPKSSMAKKAKYRLSKVK